MASIQQMEQIVIASLSPDNAVRKQAELAFQQARAQPSSYFAVLAQLLKTATRPDVRSFCAVMMRQDLTPGKQLWEAVAPVTQHLVKTTLLDLIKTETSGFMRRNINGVLGMLAATCLAAGWPEFFPALFSLTSSPQVPHQESVFHVLAVITEYCVEQVRQQLGHLGPVLCSGLSNRVTSVRLAALKATVALLIAVEEAERAQMVTTVPAMFKIVADAFQAKDDECIRQAVEQLVDLARCEPTFLRPHLTAVVNAMACTAGYVQLEEATRRMAMEFLLTLAETGRGMVRRHTDYAARTINLAFRFMTELRDKGNWDRANDSSDLEDEENFQMGVEAVDRLAMSLGGKIFLGIATPLINKLLKSPNWVQRHAALMAVGEMAQGCKRQMKQQLQATTSLVLPFAHSEPHSRVRWAALNVLGSLATEYAPVFQQKQHAQVLPVLAVCMAPSNHPRVSRFAALCLVDFCNGLAQDEDEDEEDEDDEVSVVAAHAQALLQALLLLLKSPDVKTQEAALRGVSAVAMVCRKLFTSFYDSFMPGVKSILMGARDKKFRMLRGRAMECISVMGRAVGKAKFGPDCKEIMQILVASQNGLQSDDPQYCYVLEACGRIACAMGDDFAPYLQFVVPPLLASVSVKGAFTVMEMSEAVPDDDNVDSMAVNIRGVGQKRFCVNTSLFEEQAMAARMLLKYASQLKGKFFPYVDASVKALGPLVECRYNEELRQSAICAFPALLACMGDYFKGQSVDGTGPVLALWTCLLEPFIKAVHGEFVVENLNGVLEALTEAINSVAAAGAVVPDNHVHALNTVVASLVKEMLSRRQQRETKRKQPDFDEEEAETVEAQNEEEDELLGNLYLVVRALAKQLKARYLPLFDQELRGLFMPMLTASQQGIKCAAVCVLDDIVQYCGPGANAFCDALVPALLSGCTSSDVDVRQASAFGIGTVSTALGQAFGPALPSALNALFALLSRADAKDEVNEATTECAVCALGKLLRYSVPPNQMPTVGNQSAMSVFLSFLPLEECEEEAIDAHKLLCYFLHSKNPHLLGANNCNAAKIVSVLGKVVGTSFLPNQAAQGLGPVVGGLLRLLPAADSSKVLSALPQQQQQRLQKLVS